MAAGVYVALCDKCGKVGGGYWEPENAQRTAERHYEVSGHDARVDLIEIEGTEAPVNIAPDPLITGSPVVRLGGLVAALREAADFYRPYERDSVRDEAMAVVSEAFRYLSDQIEGEVDQ